MKMQRITPGAPSSGANDDPDVLDLQRYVSIFRRRGRVMIAVGIIVFALAAVFLLKRTPEYTASAELMIDRKQENALGVRQNGTNLANDTGAIDTEIQVLRSRVIAERVVDTLHLEQDPEFNTALAPPSPLQSLIRMAGGSKPAVQDTPREARDRAVDAVQNKLAVTRSGGAYVISVAFTSPNPGKAAKLANSFAEQYLTQQLDDKLEATQRANTWLNTRLSGLRTQVEQAEAAVQQYKAQNGLLSAAGNTLTEQDLSNLNSQLAITKAAQAEQDARLATARRQLANGSTGEDVGEALTSPVVQQLRAQKAQVSRQVAELSARYGPLHPDMIKARQQLADFDDQIAAEIRRIISNLDAQAQVARQRTASIQSSIASSRGVLAGNNVASVKLNELERNAESVRTLYQSYLDRFKQTSASKGIEESEARIISQAKIPNSPSAPNVPKGLIFSFLLAAAAGGGTVFLLEALETGVSTSSDVESHLGVPALPSIPLLASTLGGKRLRMLPFDYVLDKPLSAFAESFRNLRAAITVPADGRRVQVIQVTSALPDEGKTTTTACLARMVAAGGARAVVVDCDMRRRAVSRLMAPEAKVGLVEVLNGSVDLSKALVRDVGTTAMILPIVDGPPMEQDIFSTDAMEKLLNDLRQHFDQIILDAPPVLPVADARVLAPLADAVVILMRWRRTPRRATEAAIRDVLATGANLLGVALTQVDVVEQARSGYGDVGYYYGSYKKYYTH